MGEFPPERTQYFTPTYTFPSLSYGYNSSTFVVLMRYYQIRDDFTLTTTWQGNHTFKFGGGFASYPLKDDIYGNPLGAWTFATDQYFNPDDPASLANLKNPIQYTASIPTIPIREIQNRYHEAYFQDEWQPVSNLTLNLGVRWDMQTRVWGENESMSIYPKPLPYVDFQSRGLKNNFTPRLGFAWDLKKDGKSVLRAGYGKMIHMVMNGWARPEKVTLRQSSISIRNPAYPDPYQGRDPWAYVSTAPPNISIVDNALTHPYAHTFTLGFSQELAAELAINVDGLYQRTRKFPTVVNINTPDPVTGLRRLPEWGRISQTQSVGAADYAALLVRLDKRYSNRYQYMISYTLQKHDSDSLATAGTSSRTDFYHPEYDWGPATSDRRHNLVASASVLLPYDVGLGGVWSLRSTMPFSALAGRDLNRDTATTDYVPGTTRNQGNRGLDLGLVNAWRAQNGLGPISADQIDSNRYNALDVRASKSFPMGGNRKLELIFQVFNLLGTDNLLASGGEGGWVMNALSNSFGRILTAMNCQQGELAVRFVW